MSKVYVKSIHFTYYKQTNLNKHDNFCVFKGMSQVYNN